MGSAAWMPVWATLSIPVVMVVPLGSATAVPIAVAVPRVLDTETARQQRVARQQQGIGTGGKPRRAAADGDLLADLRIACTVAGDHRRVGRGIAGQEDGIDLVAGRTVGVGRIGIRQCGGQDIDRTATAADETRAGQIATAGRSSSAPLPTVIDVPPTPMPLMLPLAPPVDVTPSGCSSPQTSCR